MEVWKLGKSLAWPGKEQREQMGGLLGCGGGLGAPWGFSCTWFQLRLMSENSPATPGWGRWRQP